MKIYAVIYTDTWQVDYMAQELWDDRSVAEDRAKELTKGLSDPDNYYYIVEEFELNKKHDPDFIAEEGKG